MKVLLVVLVVLLGCEFLIRVSEPALSLDVKHIRQIPAISQSIAESKGTRVLFLGNSQVRLNVDAAIVEREMGAQGINPLHIEKVFPDATGLADWYYAFKHYFVDAGRTPDVLILCYADNDLRDDHGADPTRLAHYYSSARDIPEIFGEDIKSFDARAEFLLSDLSYSFANRTRIRTRALNLLIPDYQESAQLINRSMKSTEKSAAPSRPTYHRLERLIAMAQQHGVRLIVIAMPQPNVYPLDSQVQSTLDAAGMAFVDCRRVEGISAASFVDEMHMSSNGAAIYSHFLARQLAQHFPPPARNITASSASR